MRRLESMQVVLLLSSGSIKMEACNRGHQRSCTRVIEGL
jgi:hypothetical protein